MSFLGYELCYEIQSTYLLALLPQLFGILSIVFLRKEVKRLHWAERLQKQIAKVACTHGMALGREREFMRYIEERERERERERKGSGREGGGGQPGIFG